MADQCQGFNQRVSGGETFNQTYIQVFFSLFAFQLARPLLFAVLYKARIPGNFTFNFLLEPIQFVFEALSAIGG